MGLIHLLEIILKGKFSSNIDTSHNMRYHIILCDIDDMTWKTLSIKRQKVFHLCWIAQLSGPEVRAET